MVLPGSLNTESSPTGNDQTVLANHRLLQNDPRLVLMDHTQQQQQQQHHLILQNTTALDHFRKRLQDQSYNANVSAPQQHTTSRGMATATTQALQIQTPLQHVGTSSASSLLLQLQQQQQQDNNQIQIVQQLNALGGRIAAPGCFTTSQQGIPGNMIHAGNQTGTMIQPIDEQARIVNILASMKALPPHVHSSPIVPTEAALSGSSARLLMAEGVGLLDKAQLETEPQRFNQQAEHQEQQTNSKRKTLRKKEKKLLREVQCQPQLLDSRNEPGKETIPLAKQQKSTKTHRTPKKRKQGEADNFNHDPPETSKKEADEQEQSHPNSTTSKVWRLGEPASWDPFVLQCQECNERFASLLEVARVLCPSCGALNTPMGIVSRTTLQKQSTDGAIVE